MYLRIIFFLFCLPVLQYGQVGIGTVTPDPSSILDLTSTKAGVLFPRMTKIQRDAIASPAEGLVIYQTDSGKGFYYFNGTSWMPIYPGADNLGNHTAVQNIITDGNWISNDGDNEGIFIASDGKVAIGIGSPYSNFRIHNPNSTDVTLQMTHQLTLGLGVILESNSSSFNMVNYENTPMYFGTNGVNRMAIANTGEVGIGTNTPASFLHLRKGATGPNVYFQHGDNVTNANDNLVSLNFGDVSAPQNQAMIKITRDAASSGSLDLPTAMSFWVTKDGQSTPTEVITIKNDANVGIGTSTPTHKLDVNGVINTSSGFRVSGAGPAGQYLRGNGASFVASPLIASDIPAGSTNYIQNIIASPQTANFNITNSSLYTAIMRSTSTSSNSAVLLIENTTATTNATFGLLVNNASSSGSGAAIKGVATSSTGDVSGVWGEASSTTTFSAGVYGRNTGAGQTYGVYGRNTSNGNFSAGTRGFSDATTAEAYGVQGVANSNHANSAGVYGVHNHSTAAVNGVYGRVTSTNASSKAIFGQATGGGFGGYFEGKGYFSANVGIGTNSPGTLLHVEGNASSHLTARFNSASNTGTWLTFYNSSASGQWFHLINTASGNGEGAGKLMFIRGSGAGSTTGSPSIIIEHSSGRVGINTNAPDQQFTVIGDASKTTGAFWANYSDARLKTNVSAFTKGLNCLLQIQPVYFQYKKDNPLGIDSEGKQAGFIAQELEKVIPEAVFHNPTTGFLSIKYDPIFLTMLNAIKDLHQIKADKHDYNALKIENEQLKQELEVLKSQVQRLEAQMNKLLNASHSAER